MLDEYVGVMIMGGGGEGEMRECWLRGWFCGQMTW